MDKCLYNNESTEILFDESDRFQSIVLLSLFSDIDLLMIVLGSTDDLDDRH